MISNLDSLRERIVRAPTNRRGYRQYSRELRTDIKAHAASRVYQGASYKQVAKELGLAEATLLSWCKDAAAKKARESQPMGFRAVEVRAQRDHEPGSESSSCRTKPTSRPVVVLPNGIRVEGLSVEELPNLLARLECY